MDDRYGKSNTSCPNRGRGLAKDSIRSCDLARSVGVHLVDEGIDTYFRIRERAEQIQPRVPLKPALK
jgi:hypothetical protein